MKKGITLLNQMICTFSIFLVSPIYPDNCLRMYIVLNWHKVIELTLVVNHLFMPLAWKVRRGHLVFGSSVRLSVRNSAPLINEVQYIKFGWSYSNQTRTVSSSKGCSHLTDITCYWGWGGVKMQDLEIFAIASVTFLPPGHLCFTNTSYLN